MTCLGVWIVSEGTIADNSTLPSLARQGRVEARPHTVLADLLLTQLFEEQADGLDAAIKIWDVKFLVGCVQIVVGKAEAHHHRRDLQHVLKIGDDWNRSAGANEYRFFLEHVVQSFGGGLDVSIVRADYACRTFAPDFDAGLDPFRRELLYVVLYFLRMSSGPGWEPAAWKLLQMLWQESRSWRREQQILRACRALQESDAPRCDTGPIAGLAG